MTPERLAKLKAALARRQPDLTVYMDAVNKSHNVSAIVRTADAVGVHGLHALATLAALRAEGFRLVAAHASAQASDYRSIDYTAKVAIMVGAELVGLSEAALEEADEHVAIPMHGLGTSLNVSVAVGAILLEAERQRRAAGLYESSRLSSAEHDATLFEWCYPDIAERCRQLGRAYPPLTDDGMMAWNPLLDVAAK
jgi:tRNA (guanosine-2'-O-)-methyltransferase